MSKMQVIQFILHANIEIFMRKRKGVKKKKKALYGLKNVKLNC